jgi:DNA-binding HxlR family transcriptional regulator
MEGNEKPKAPKTAKGPARKAVRKPIRSHCPINFALEVFGDKWSLLIIRDIVFFGKKTYGEFLKSEEGFATNVLAARLVYLEQVGILRKSPHTTDKRKDFYNLTEKGLDFIPMMLQIVHWSVKYDPKSKAREGVRAKLLAKVVREPDAAGEDLKTLIRKGGRLFPAGET